MIIPNTHTQQSRRAALIQSERPGTQGEVHSLALTNLSLPRSLRMCSQDSPLILNDGEKQFCFTAAVSPGGSCSALTKLKYTHKGTQGQRKMS